jgi:pyridoxamine 5'-phosphate oxidase
MSPVGVAPDPLAIFDRWLREAVTAGLVGARTMALATATSRGEPSVRLVILRRWDGDGLEFHTNLASRKAVEIDANPRASLVMLWHPLGRQVRVEGAVTRLSTAEADARFRSHTRSTQIGLMSSPQSRVIDSLDEVRHRRASEESAWAGREVERPEYWGGYRVDLEVVEFWEEARDGLHRRRLFRRLANSSWSLEYLAP